VRQEVRAARLLAERKHGPDQERCGKCRASEPRPGLDQDEVERHQRESRAGMGSRIARAAGQVVRTIGKQRDPREFAAVVPKVARAIDVRRLLHQADGRRTQDQGADHEGSGAA